MKIVVIGGSGLMGSQVVAKLTAQGHQAVPASPKSGVNTVTGEGLAEILEGASVAVDVSNAPSFEDAAVLEFFTTSTRNLLSAEAAAGVRHHVALSVVGSERLTESGYFRAKIAQEGFIKASPIPYSIVRATQFFEFVRSIADVSIDGNEVRLPPAQIQPMAADDVATAVTGVAMGSPVQGTIEVGGPEEFRLDELVCRDLAARDDPRPVVADPQARYYGVKLSRRALVPGDDARLGRFEDWLRQSVNQSAATNRRPRTGCGRSESLVDWHEHDWARNTQGSTVTCPYHGTQFNVCAGPRTAWPSKGATHHVTVEGESVELKLRSV